MIAQLFLSFLLSLVGLYAWTSFRRTPQIALVVAASALAGLYFVWFPGHATWLAERVGIGRGVDLVLYVWVVVSLLAILNLHLLVRGQLELITVLARKIALAEVAQAEAGGGGEADPTQGNRGTPVDAAR
jgi:hypothetical protein